MSYKLDPKNNPIDRVRLLVGDTDECDEGLSDDIYQFLLDTTKNEKQAALSALRYLVAKYASYVTEKAGGLFVKGSEKYQQYVELLDKITKDPSFSFLNAGSPFAGGISKEDIRLNSINEDANRNPIREGQFKIHKEYDGSNDYHYRRV